MLRSLLLASVISFAAMSPSFAKDTAGGNALMSYDAIHHPVLAKNGMVSAQDRIAAEVGRDIWHAEVMPLMLPSQRDLPWP